MSNQMTGRIISISGVEQIPSKNGTEPFKKRTVVLNCSRSVYGETYENYPSFEFSGKHIDDPMQFQIGDIVDLSFVIQGKKSQKDGQPVKFFNTIAGYKIEVHQRQQVAAPLQQAQVQQTPMQSMQTQMGDDLPF